MAGNLICNSSLMGQYASTWHFILAFNIQDHEKKLSALRVKKKITLSPMTSLRKSSRRLPKTWHSQEVKPVFKEICKPVFSLQTPLNRHVSPARCQLYQHTSFDHQDVWMIVSSVNGADGMQMSWSPSANSLGWERFWYVFTSTQF